MYFSSASPKDALQFSYGFDSVHSLQTGDNTSVVLNLTTGNVDRINVYGVLFHGLFIGSLILHDK
jgi:hypothetical protein